MYLITVYFDFHTTSRIQRIIDHIAEYSGNHFMIENQVPPHLTLFSLDTNHKDQLITLFNQLELNCIDLEAYSFGYLPSGVVYLAPLYLNAMQEMMNRIFDQLSTIDDLHYSRYYQVDRFLPHITVGKKLTQLQSQKAMEALIYTFSPVIGKITSIELSEVKPYTTLSKKELL